MTLLLCRLHWLVVVTIPLVALISSGFETKPPINVNSTNSSCWGSSKTVRKLGEQTCISNKPPYVIALYDLKAAPYVLIAAGNIAVTHDNGAEVEQ